MLPELETTARPVSRTSAVIALLITVPMPSLAVLVSMWWLSGTAIATGVYFLTKLWQVIVPAVWHRCVDRQPISFSRPRLGGFGVAAGLGLAIAVIIIGGYLLLGDLVISDPEAFRAQASANDLDQPGRYLAFAGYILLLNALMEEYFWRWFVFRKCESILSGWGRGVAITAIFLAAALFTVHHVIALAAQFGWLLTTLASLGVMIGGLVWSELYARYRSIWPGYLSHSIVNIAMFIVGWWMLFGGSN